MRLVPYFFVVGLTAAALGCSSTAADTTTIVRPELIQVSPTDFLGVQTCRTSSVDVQSYVATLFDVTPLASGVVPDPGFQLPSSPATPCTEPVTFSNVITGHVYLADVDAYDRDVGQLEAKTPGARIQFDPHGEDSDRISPRWIAKCGAYRQSLVVDGGSYVSFGGAPTASDIAADEAGAAGAGGSGEGDLVGLVSYDAVTQTPHDCGRGLHEPEK